MVTAVVPVKKLSEAKIRLSGFLSPLERKKLFLAMLFDVLDNLENTAWIKGIYIVTPDEKIEVIVDSHYKNIHTIKEPVPSNLNNALHHATCYLENSHISRILIIPGDLPLAKTSEIESLIFESYNSSMTIVPDKTFHGTNLLILNPPSIIKTCFGPDSFMAHIKQANEKGISYNIFSTCDLLWDIDRPADIPAIIYNGYGTRTYREIFKLGINCRIQSNRFNDISAKTMDSLNH
jgi:2-phospho-L-lactate guanylyltransferase